MPKNSSIGRPAENLRTMTENRPKIGIVGTGAIGGYYGGLLARAGEDVHFLLRSDYEAVKANGLRIILADDSEYVLKPTQAYAKPEDMGPCDIVIITLKSTGNTLLSRLLPPLLKDDTLMITFQNGFGAGDGLAQEYGADRVLGGLCFICLNRLEPGVIKNFYPGYLSIGEYAGPPQERTRQIVEMFDKAGVRTILSESLEEALWRKLFWNIPFNGLTIAAGGIPTDKVLDDENLALLARKLMEEVQTAAAAHGHDIPDDFIDLQFEHTYPMGAYKPSSLVDYLDRRDVEVETIWGEPLRRGQAKGVSMPHLFSLYSLLKRLVADNLKQDRSG